MSSVRQKRTEVHKTEARKEEALRHGIEPVEEKIEVVEEAVVEETPPAPEKPKTKKPAPKAKAKPAKKFK
jgi:hypothetical protein|tara:strand:+ start:131 stop:340 length:210 start_codon:yes stop_codon:yes gene_type:complete